MEHEALKEANHHKQINLCKTRPAYRQGRNLTAVKVYTVNNESQHLFVYGVPKINLRIELKNLCLKYGQIARLQIVTDYKTEIFTECYHVQYQHIQSARIAKKLLDNRSFYGGILHVCYAPEYENVAETKAKLHQRAKDVLTRLDNGDKEGARVIKRVIDRKRKHPAIAIDEERMADLNASDVWKDVPADLDPMLQGFRSKRADKPVKHYQIRGVEYGPHLSDLKASWRQSKTVVETSEISMKANLIPTQVLKRNVVKKIVFKKRIV